MLFALVPGRRKIPLARTKETEEKEHKTITAPTLINHLFIFAFLLYIFLKLPIFQKNSPAQKNSMAAWIQ